MNDKTNKLKSIILEMKALDRYLLSRGIDPRFVTTDQKVSHAKSGEFQKWLSDRKVEEVQSEDELIEQKTPREKFKSGLKKAGYDPDKGAKRLTDLIAKQKKDREEHEKKYGHLYAKEATDYSLVKGQSTNQYNKDVKLSNGYVTKVAKQPKGEYERSVDKYLKKKYNKEEVENFKSGDFVKDIVHGHTHRVHKVEGNNLVVNKHQGKDSYGTFTNLHKTKARKVATPTNEEVEFLEEEHLVHVSDGSKYGNEPDAKDTEHVIAGIKKHNGKYDGASDKGAYFKFNSKSDAESFKAHVDRCPNRSCHADLHEGVLDFMKKPNKKQDAIHYVKVNNALKTTPSGKHIMKFPDRESAERHANEHKKLNPNHNVKVTTDRGTEDPTWHGGTKTRPYSYGMREEMEMDENHIAIAMGKMLDDESSMALNQLDQIERSMKLIRDYIGKDYEKQLPAWVQSKITLASDYIDTVGSYLSTSNEKVNESFEEEHGISDKKKQNSKSARIIKSIYKKKNMKEDIYDHEKDDKSTQVYGKKPNLKSMDDKGMGENKPDAVAVMSGGKTLTGQKRDIIEIDPMLRKRPGQPDTKK